MKPRLYLLFLILFSALHTSAQMPETYTASGILMHMKKLNVLGSVLYIAAHPDDENTRLLAWLSKEKLYRTGYLSLTRGDGGQNLIGDEQGVELGLIRTEELLAARRIDGAEQFFSRAFDFGFSKTTKEALRIWNEEKILSDVVWVIRKFQPDIIIVRFPEDKRAGHGQHSASAVLARLGYSESGDPKKFPGQFAFGVGPWQPQRLFLNNYRFGNISTTNDNDLKMQVGGFNSIEGKSYGEIAADSRSQHRSQGFGVPHTRGAALEYFAMIAGRKADSSLMENIDCSWNRIPGGKSIGENVTSLIKNYDASVPYASVNALTKIYRDIESLPDGYWRSEKLQETQELIKACSGLYLEAVVSEPYAVQNGLIPVTIQAVNRSPLQMSLTSLTVNTQDTVLNQNLENEMNFGITKQISLHQLPVSQPYWLIEPMSTGSFNVNNQKLIGMPENPPALAADFAMVIDGLPLHFKLPVMYKFTNPALGEQFQPLTIVPPVMAYCDPSLLVFTKDKTGDLHVVNQWKTTASRKTSSNIIVTKTTESKATVETRHLMLTKVAGIGVQVLPGTEYRHNFALKSVGVQPDQNNSTWVVNAGRESMDTLMQCRTIQYDHIPRIDYFRPARSVIVSVDLKIAGKRVGYIDGAGDRVPEALRAMGFEVVSLSENSVNLSVLQSLDAVIAGVRAYDVHDWMAGKYPVLMEYVKNGGNLIVQYNRNQGNDTTGLGPFPFGISNARISEEDAAVRFMVPESPVLHFPNTITAKDFDGWIQERSIYVANHIDPSYQTVLSMNDTDEPEQNGSLITATYGKGNFTYTGLVFFRELPAGVPGAYRLLANLIALNQHK